MRDAVRVNKNIVYIYIKHMKISKSKRCNKHTTKSLRYKTVVVNLPIIVYMTQQLVK